MPEYGSSGIWSFTKDESGPWRHGMVEHSLLALPKELSKKFNDWIEQYDTNLDNELNYVSFNSEGLALAYELYLHLEKNNYVEYQGELEDGSLDEPIIIGDL